MRLLLQGRSTVGSDRGGDSTVIDRLAAELLQLGHDVAVRSVPGSDVSQFDAVHACNLDRSVILETLSFAEAARAAKLRLVVTPLWWPLRELIGAMPLIDQLRFCLRGFGPVRVVASRNAAWLRGLRRLQERVLRAADVVAPSGRQEGAVLEAEFGSLPVAVVPFGTGASPSRVSTNRSGVLCVARIDPRKNQLGLISAVEGLDTTLRLVGTHDIFPRYAAKCRAAAGPNVRFDGYLSDEGLEDAYATSLVHALPSFFELPGLTSLDAAASGVGIVAPSAGTARDYFGDRVQYADTDPVSIRAALVRSLETPVSPRLSEYTRAEFTWRRTAERYEQLYER